MTLVERFLTISATIPVSDEETNMTPSTPGQMVFVKHLKEELEKMGLEEITLDDNGYLMASLPSNTDKTVPTVGFIAHAWTRLLT